MIPAYLSALANHLWQSTLFLVLAWFAARALRNNSARVRHWIWLAASVKFLIPFSLLITIGGRFEWRAAPAIARPALTTLAGSIGPFAEQAPFALSLSVSAADTPASSPVPTVLFAVWLCGFAVVMLSWFNGWRRIRNAARGSSPLGLPDLQIPIRSVSCAEQLEPGVFGIFRPVLMLPEGITERLQHAQLQAVIAHELCHVRRRDNLATSMHMLVEAVFWFYPLVWWIESRLIAEQESACDEEVLRLGSDPQVYAESILRVCEFYVASPLVCARGIAGSDLKRRMVSIMSNKPATRLSFVKSLMLAAIALASVSVPFLLGSLRAAQSAPPVVFEAASIRPSRTGGAQGSAWCRGTDGLEQLGMGQVGTEPGQGRCILQGVTLRMIAGAASGNNIMKNFLDHDVFGGPAWADSDRFEIDAKAADPSTATIAQLLQMLQQLLVERFKLKSHREIKEVSGYALVVAKNGLKMEAAAGDEPQRFNAGRPGGGQLSAQNLPLETIRAFLAQSLDRPVLDKTGLTGNYKFELKWKPGEEDVFGARWRAGAPERADLGALDPGAPSLFTALQEQLGLRLESVRVPIETIVIDQAEKPTPN